MCRGSPQAPSHSILFARVQRRHGLRFGLELTVQPASLCLVFSLLLLPFVLPYVSAVCAAASSFEF
jgi:hypothetical protein